MPDNKQKEMQKRRASGLKVFGGFEVKDQLKSAGGIWDPDNKCWLMPSREACESCGAIHMTGKFGPYFGFIKKTKRKSTTTFTKSYKRPCEYPGCSLNYCDECS